MKSETSSEVRLIFEDFQGDSDTLMCLRIKALGRSVLWRHKDKSRYGSKTQDGELIGRLCTSKLYIKYTNDKSGATNDVLVLLHRVTGQLKGREKTQNNQKDFTACVYQRTRTRIKPMDEREAYENMIGRDERGEERNQCRQDWGCDVEYAGFFA